MPDLGHVIEILCLLRGLLLYRDEAAALEIRPERVIYVCGRHLPHLEVPQVLLPQREGVVRKGIGLEGQVTIHFLGTARVEIRVLQLCVGHSVHRVARDLPREVLQVVPLGQSRSIATLSEFLIIDGPICVGRLR